MNIFRALILAIVMKSVDGFTSISTSSPSSKKNTKLPSAHFDNEGNCSLDSPRSKRRVNSKKTFQIIKKSAKAVFASASILLLQPHKSIASSPMNDATVSENIYIQKNQNEAKVIEGKAVRIANELDSEMSEMEQAEIEALLLESDDVDSGVSTETKILVGSTNESNNIKSTKRTTALVSPIIGVVGAGGASFAIVQNYKASKKEEMERKKELQRKEFQQIVRLGKQKVKIEEDENPPDALIKFIQRTAVPKAEKIAPPSEDQNEDKEHTDTDLSADDAINFMITSEDTPVAENVDEVERDEPSSSEKKQL